MKNNKEVKDINIYTGILTFQVKEINNGIATGAINIYGREPKRDDFFHQTGEVEFGGGYQATGSFNDDGYYQALHEWGIQSYPIGLYKEKFVNIPEGIKIKPGQYIRVKYVGKLSNETEFIFHKDRVGENISVKKFKLKI